MTYIPVVNMNLPESMFATGNINVNTSSIATSDALYVWTGRIRWADPSVATKDIRKFHFLLGTVTKAGGSGLTLSVQAFDTANGPPGRPNGTPIRSAAIANGNATFVSNTVCTTSNIDVDHTVSYGERLCLVLGYDTNGRLGADSVGILSVNTNVESDGAVTFVSSVWGSQTAHNSIVVEFSDGTYGVLDPALPWSNNTIQVTVGSGTSPDEIALKFTPNFKCKINGIWASIAPAGAGDFDIILYEGTTPLKTVSYDANTMRTTTNHCVLVTFDEEVELTPGTAYYLAVKPTTATTFTMRAISVMNTDVRALLSGGAIAHWSGRVDGGAWSDTTTRFPFIGARISSIDDGSGGGGGGGVADPLGGNVV